MEVTQGRSDVQGQFQQSGTSNQYTTLISLLFLCFNMTGCGIESEADGISGVRPIRFESNWKISSIEQVLEISDEAARADVKESLVHFGKNYQYEPANVELAVSRIELLGNRSIKYAKVHYRFHLFHLTGTDGQKIPIVENDGIDSHCYKIDLVKGKLIP